MKYAYVVTGAAAGGQWWQVEGEIDAASLVSLPPAVMGEAFEQLTGGRAVYGYPGQGCNGPYKITKLLIEEKPVVREM